MATETIAGRKSTARRVPRFLNRGFGESLVLRLFVLVASIAIWELAVGDDKSRLFNVSKPSLIGQALVKQVTDPQFWGDHMRVTMQEILIGWLLGSVAGVLFGLILARFRLVQVALDPFLMAIYSLPRVALAPLFIIWFGIGVESKVALIVSIVFFIMIINTMVGAKNVDQDLVNSVRTMGANTMFVTRRVILPSIVPWVFSGLRIGIGLALIGAVVGEMLAAQFGMGFIIARASGSFDTKVVFSTLIVLAIVAMLLNEGMKTVERRLLRWQGDVAL